MSEDQVFQGRSPYIGTKTQGLGWVNPGMTPHGVPTSSLGLSCLRPGLISDEAESRGQFECSPRQLCLKDFFLRKKFLGFNIPFYPVDSRTFLPYPVARAFVLQVLLGSPPAPESFRLLPDIIFRLNSLTFFLIQKQSFKVFSFGDK